MGSTLALVCLSGGPWNRKEAALLPAVQVLLE